MQELFVAQLFKSSAGFCSSTVHDSNGEYGVNVPGLHTLSETADVLGKRRRVECLLDFFGNEKKLKSNSQALPISRQCYSLVGRLQLCNKRRHSWGGIAAAGDCLSFTDSAASVCCSVSRGLDVSLVGKLVRVTSWSFIPVKDSHGVTKPNPDQCTTKSITRISVSEDMAPKGNSNFRAGKRQDCDNKNFTTGGPESGTDIWDIHRDAVDGSGFLEIHSLELLDKQDMEVATFPSMCVDRMAADIRSALFETPPAKREEERSRLTICGTVQSISPQFSLPCIVTDDRDDTKTSSGIAASPKDNRQKSMIGFLVELDYCHSCSCHYIDPWTIGAKKECRMSRQLFEDGQLSVVVNSRHEVNENHGDENFYSRDSFCVYFSGSLAAWRPILSGNIKHCLKISGLRRKLVLTGIGRKYQLLLVATRTSLVLPVLDAHHSKVRDHCIPEKKDPEGKRDEENRGHLIPISDFQGYSAIHNERCVRNFGRISGEDRPNHSRVISYAGIATSILFQGKLVELDKHVWLLFTHQEKSQLHGLRVGAMLALRDVHAITICNPSEKALVLGACIRSHVSVILFSPLRSPPLNPLHSPSLLLRYLRKVSFASAFWILSLIGSFRQKFRGIYSDKELMGSKKDPGIILKYVQNLLAPDDSLERPDYFKEFFDHQHISCTGGSLASVSLSKVPPISNFCQDLEASLQCSRSSTWLSRPGDSRGFQRWLKTECLQSSPNLSSPNWQFAHSIISSQELGVTLLGSLQVCQKSGQLQLMDATGFVYVVVPDLFSSTHISKTYQVSSFTVMTTGLTEGSNIAGNTRNEGGRDSSISWSSLLKVSKGVSLSQASGLFVHFFLRDATVINTMSFCERTGESFSQGLKRRRLDHKHTRETWNMMMLDLETISTWVEQRVSELESNSSHTSHLKLLCDSFGGLNHPDELFRVSCKVVAVDLLVFEYQGPMSCEIKLSSESTSWSDLEHSDDDWLFSLGIPLTLASVVVDDGSGLAHCWAHGDAAVSLLGLGRSSVHSDLPLNLLARLWDKYGRTDMQFTMMQCLCCLVKKHGKVVLRSERPYGASIDSSYSLQWYGGQSPDSDEQGFMRAVVARACHNHPLVVTLGNIPPTVKPLESSKSPLECCRTFAHRIGVQRSRPQDNEWPQLFATMVESSVLLSDAKAVGEEISRLLGKEL